MDNCNCPVNTPFDSAYRIEFLSVLQSEKVSFQFSLHEKATNQRQYHSQQCYATKEEANRQAHLICLRIALDREKRPALTVDLPTRKILSLNLSAFYLLGINAVGFETREFTVHHESHEQVYQELQQAGQSCQSLWLRDADGRLVSCQIQANRVVNFPQWGIVRLRVNTRVTNF